MPLTSRGRDIIRMEDVLYTLNNIVDDIASMYAGSPDGLDAASLEADDESATWISESEDGGTISLPALPSSPTLSASPISDGDLELDDAFKLYSSSSASSPTSSGFPTPSTSPTSFAFLIGKDSTSTDAVSSHVSIFNGGESAMHMTPNDARSRPCLPDSLKQPCPRLQGINPSHVISSPALAQILPTNSNEDLNSEPDLPHFAVGLSNTSSDPNLPTCVVPPRPSEPDALNIIYQTSLHSSSQITDHEPLLTSAINPMPGICPPHLTMAPPRLSPRPPTARDAPPHLPALCSPNLLSAPKLDQNEEWTTDSQLDPTCPDLWAVHLAKQRQWARMTITYAASLTEPENLPPYRPVEQFLDLNSRTSVSISPPRRRILGALGRRVHVGPKILPRGDWNPDKRGGVLDHWKNGDAQQSNKMKTYGNVEANPGPKSRHSLGLRIRTTRAANDEDANHEDSKTKDQDRTSHASKHSNPAQMTDPKETEEEQMTKKDPSGMRWCVKDGIRVPPPVADENLSAKPDSGASDSSLVIEPAPAGMYVPRTTVPSSQAEFTPELVQPPTKYVPKRKSPLSRASIAPPAAVRFRLMAPAASSFSNTRRKFTSMTF